MNLAIVRFNDSNDDRIPAPRRAEYQRVLREAIEAFRPPTETWTILTHVAPDGTVLTFDFSRGTEIARPLTFQPEGDDNDHSSLFRIASVFCGCIGLGRCSVLNGIFCAIDAGPGCLPATVIVSHSSFKPALSRRDT